MKLPSMKDVFEGLSGTSKMSYGQSLYDPKEGKKWRDRQESHYQDFGKRQKRYEGQSKKFLDMYGKGKAEAKSMYDQSVQAYRGSEADISRARGHQRSADALMGDRAFYADLAKDRERIKKGYESARLEQESLRSGMGRLGSGGANQMMMRDAFKEIMNSEEESLNQQTAQLAKTNPVAAAKLKLDFQANMQKGYGKAIQEGFGKDVQLDMNRIMSESGLIMRGAGTLEGEAKVNAQSFNERQAMIGNYGAASTGALNTAGVQQNLAGGLSNIAGNLSNMAGRDLGAGMQYEGMGYNALKDQASTANMNVSQQQQLQMSDANARAQVDQFNQNRASRGLSNALAIANTAVGIGGAISSANLAGAQADYLRGGLGVTDSVLKSQVQNNSSDHPRNVRFVNQGRGPGGGPVPTTALSPSDMYHSKRNSPASNVTTNYNNSGQRPDIGYMNNQLSGNVGLNQTVNDINNMAVSPYSGYSNPGGGTTMPGNYNTQAFQNVYQNAWQGGGSKDPNRYMWDGDYGFGFKGIKKNQ